MSEKLTVKLGAAEVDFSKLALKDGDILVARHRGQSPPYLEQMRKLSDALRDRGLKDVFIIAMADDLILEEIDARIMERHGWTRTAPK